MLLQRAISAFILGPLAIWLIYLGGWFYFLPLAAVLLIATFEYSHIVQELGWNSPLWLLLPSIALQWILSPSVQQQLFQGRKLSYDLAPLALLISLLAGLCYALWLYEKRTSENAISSWLAIMGGVLLLGWVGGHLFRIRGLEHMAVEWTTTAIASNWVADSSAYVVGKKFGRHRLSPRLSPNKTVEGYLGGVVLGTTFAIILGGYLGISGFPALILGVLVSGVGSAGDLGISMLKREIGLKDSGHFLPGHGGALDRTDSLIWSVALVYYLALLVN